MLLVDLNQVLLAGLMVQISGQKNIKLEENLVRHLVLNILRGHVRQFRQEYGEVVLCCDNQRYWRKEYFPFYKASRKKNRDKSSLDWHLIFSILGNLKQELKDNFPYKVIDVDGAEADDIIGTLAPRHCGTEKILILSSDGDFLQLQRYNNIKQYSPTTKKYLVSENPAAELKAKIIGGDTGDGIPNILSPGDTIVRGIRQKSMTEVKLNAFLNEDHNNYDEVARTGFTRNQVLIDLTNIPTDIKESIIHTYDNTKPVPRSKLIPYFMDKKLKNLMDVIGEF
jgi:5'-3' exonuclease